ncbi:MAG: hypothetical protein V4629_11675 [Pseudomonadota bacterium]
MNLPKCSLKNSLSETDLLIAAEQDTLEKILVVEVENGFCVLVEMKWAKDKKWFISTRRERHSPRLFKDLNRLNAFLKEHFPFTNYVLKRNGSL